MSKNEGTYSRGTVVRWPAAATASSRSAWPLGTADGVYPEGGPAGKRLGGKVLSIQATTAECR